MPFQVFPICALPHLSIQWLGVAQVIGTIGFGAAVAAYNGRVVTEAFDAFILILRLEGTHMHFVFFDITGHDVLPSLLTCRFRSFVHSIAESSADAFQDYPQQQTDTPCGIIDCRLYTHICMNQSSS
jgi:hypothetical protein